MVTKVILGISKDLITQTLAGIVATPIGKALSVWIPSCKRERLDQIHLKEAYWQGYDQRAREEEKAREDAKRNS